MAEKAGKVITPHAANMSRVTIFTLYLMGAIKNAGPYVEFSIEGPQYHPWQYGLYDDFPVAGEGTVQIPEGPEWGISIRESWLQCNDYQCSEWQC
ncbi:MAG: hypothetical protein MJK13_19275 [Pseudomonadales bacterium]|nr:hypothetical protein [Pseudomonadales bacterium]